MAVRDRQGGRVSPEPRSMLVRRRARFSSRTLLVRRRIENRVGSLRCCLEQPQRFLLASECLEPRASALQHEADRLAAVGDVGESRHRIHHADLPCAVSASNGTIVMVSAALLHGFSSAAMMSSAMPSGPLALPRLSRDKARRIASGSAPCWTAKLKAIAASRALVSAELSDL